MLDGYKMYSNSSRSSKIERLRGEGVLPQGEGGIRPDSAKENKLLLLSPRFQGRGATGGAVPRTARSNPSTRPNRKEPTWGSFLFGGEGGIRTLAGYCYPLM